MFKHDKLNDDITTEPLTFTSLLQQHFLVSRNHDEVVFYFLARILKNEERESRRKKVKDTPQVMLNQCLVA